MRDPFRPLSDAGQPREIPERVPRKTKQPSCRYTGEGGQGGTLPQQLHMPAPHTHQAFRTPAPESRRLTPENRHSASDTHHPPSGDTRGWARGRGGVTPHPTGGALQLGGGRDAWGGAWSSVPRVLLAGRGRRALLCRVRHPSRVSHECLTSWELRPYHRLYQRSCAPIFVRTDRVAPLSSFVQCVAELRPYLRPHNV